VQIGCEPLKTIVMGPLELPVVTSPAIETALHWLEGPSQMMHQTGDCVAFFRNPAPQTKGFTESNSKPALHVMLHFEGKPDASSPKNPQAIQTVDDPPRTSRSPLGAQGGKS
jgi:hypothetical protein